MRNRKSDVPDSRAYQSGLERELILGGLVIGLIIGMGGIYLIWGPSAAGTALFCFAGFLVLVLIIWAFLKLLEWVGRSG